VKLQTRLHQIIENTDGCRVYGISFVGGLSPHVEPEEGDKVPEQRLLRMAKRAVEECGYRPGVDVAMGLDCKAGDLERAYQRWSNTENVGQYFFWRAEGAEPMTREELLEIYRNAIERDNIPIIFLQNPFSPGDTEGWAGLMGEFGEEMLIVGDDNAPTNDEAIEGVSRQNLINAIALKPNRIGTLSETLLAALVALGKDLDVVLCHCPESPNEDMESHIALALQSLGLQAGGGLNTERLVKYASVVHLVNDAIQRQAGNSEVSGEDKRAEEITERLMDRLVITNVIAHEEPTNAGFPSVKV
jgi:enolase